MSYEKIWEELSSKDKQVLEGGEKETDKCVCYKDAPGQA